MTTYAEKLRDPRWQKRRLEILQRDEFRCTDCFDNTKTLHVHHLDYIKGREPWEYDDSFLLTLCEDCHKRASEERPQWEERILVNFRTKIKTTFHMECVADVFGEYENLEELFYLLRELRRQQKEVDSALLQVLFKDRDAIVAAALEEEKNNQPL